MNATRDFPHLSGVSLGIALAILAAIVSGFSIYINGHASRAFESAALFASLKNAVVGCAFLVFFIKAGAPRRITLVKTGTRLKLLAIAIVGGSIPFVLFFEGLSRMSAADAAFIQKTLFLWVAILAVIFLKEHLGPTQMFALGALFAAQFLIGGPRGMDLAGGELMVLAATLLWAVESLVAKSVLKEVDTSVAATARMAGGAVILLGYILASGQFAAIGQLGWNQWLWILGTAVILVTYVSLWYGALKYAPASSVTALLAMGAPITAFLNVFIDGRRAPDVGQLAGYALVIIAIASIGYLAVFYNRKPQRAREMQAGVS